MVDVGCRSGGGRCVLVVAVVASVVGRGGRHCVVVRTEILFLDVIAIKIHS